jgi:hypothetical protein
MMDAKRWDDLANSILCVGLLEWQADVSRSSRQFVRPLLKHRREQVRYAAAIYLSWHEPSVDAYEIVRELSSRDDYECCAPLPFNGYDWTGFARKQLTRVWDEPVEVGQAVEPERRATSDLKQRLLAAATLTETFVRSAETRKTYLQERPLFLP